MSTALLQVPVDVDARVKRIYDHLYANAAVRTPAGIAAEVGKLIRTASFMERGAGLFPAFSLAPDVRRKLVIGDAVATSKFATEIRESFSKMNSEWKLYDNDEILLSDSDISWCCAELDGVIISAGKRDFFGDAVEIFRTSWAKQSSGQFFTDGRITHLALVLVRFDPFCGHDLVDICCGTGGFLLAGLNHIRHLAERRLPAEEVEKAVADLGLRSLRGQEVDPEICDVANASLTSRLGRANIQLISCGNSLHPTSFGANSPSGLQEGSHICAVSNPPFGTKITVKDIDILKNYELASTDGRRASPRAPDILLLERNVRMLRPGTGRLAIVIPYQILSGPQTRYIRQWLIRNTHLEAVIDLPAETFQPHTGTKTSLLVVRRRERVRTDAESEPSSLVFMSTPKWIGHDRRGKPVYRRGPDGVTTADVLSDIEDVERAFQEYLSGSEPATVHPESFTVLLSQIESDSDLRLNARYYRDASAQHSRSGMSPKGWKLVRLGDVCERIFCPTRFKRNYVEPSEAAVPFLGGSNISELLADTTKWLRRDESRIADLLVREGWLLVTRSGTTGIVSTVPTAWNGVAMSEHIIRIVPRRGSISPAWLQAYLRSRFGQRALAKGVFGSVIDEITTDFIANLEIPVPDSQDQYQSVVSTIERAEAARQDSIIAFRSAIDRIESMMREAS